MQQLIVMITLAVLAKAVCWSADPAARRSTRRAEAAAQRIHPAETLGKVIGCLNIRTQ
jgi:hypothetical protein